MNLKKGSSYDFDLLAENKSLDVGDSEDGLTLVLQKFSPYPITVIITPTEGKARVEVYLRKLEQYMTFEVPLATARKMSISLEMNLAILRKQGLDVAIPLMRSIEAVCLFLSQPLKIAPIKLTIKVDKIGEKTFGIEWKGRFGRTRKETVKTLKDLLKLLKEGE